MKEALKLALEALQAVQPECDDFHHKKKEMHDWSEICKPLERYNQAITAIKETLAQPEQGPYCWTWDEFISGGKWRAEYGWKKPERKVTNLQPLYTTPPQRTWDGLTDEETAELVHRYAFYELTRQIEAKLKEKNT